MGGGGSVGGGGGWGSHLWRAFCMAIASPRLASSCSACSALAGLAGPSLLRGPTDEQTLRWPAEDRTLRFRVLGAALEGGVEAAAVPPAACATAAAAAILDLVVAHLPVPMTEDDGSTRLPLPTPLCGAEAVAADLPETLGPYPDTRLTFCSSPRVLEWSLWLGNPPYPIDHTAIGAWGRRHMLGWVPRGIVGSLGARRVDTLRRRYPG